MSQPSVLSHTQKKLVILKNLKYLWRFQFAPIIHDFWKCFASSELYSIYIFFHQVLKPASSSLSLCFQGEHQKKVSNMSERGGSSHILLSSMRNRWNHLILEKFQKELSITYKEHPQQLWAKIFLFQRECELLQTWAKTTYYQGKLKLFLCIIYFTSICFLKYSPAALVKRCCQTG